MSESVSSRQEVCDRYHYWRNRQLFSTYVGYVVFYCLRKNIPIAVPLLTHELAISKVAFGIFFTLHDLVYGAAKFIAGVAADRFNPRYLISAGLLLAALTNLGFSLGSTVMVLGVLWVLNGFFQGFGFPPSARILSYWFRPRERGLKWGIFNTSHQVGTAVILAWGAYLGHHYGWRAIFWGPGLLGVVVAMFLAWRLRDTPESMGMPPVESNWDRPEEEPDRAQRGFSSAAVDAPSQETTYPIGGRTDAPASEEPLAKLVSRRVYRNPAIWLSCLANFFVYGVRYGVLNWAPTYLIEVKKVNLLHAGLMTGTFEIAGLVGCLFAGWATDRFYHSRRAPVCVFCMVVCAVFILMFWQAPVGNPWWATMCLAGVGFTVYGPQFLGGLMSADLAGKRAAGTAVGFHGFFGYLSGLLSGIGVSLVVTNWGWDVAYAGILGCSLLAALSFVPIWNARAPEEDHA